MRKRLSLFRKINWRKTLYINFKMLPFEQAKKLPIVVFGKCSFRDMIGKITVEGDVYFGKIGIGQKYQMFQKDKGQTEFHIFGELVFKGRFQFGVDTNVYVGRDGKCVLGDMASLGGNSILICTKKVIFGDYCRFGTYCYVGDSNFHHLINTETQEVHPISFDIQLGNYNFISTRVTIMGKAMTADNVTIASNTVVSKDYRSEGENIIIGGVPAQVVKRNIKRYWEKEQPDLEIYLKI